MKTIWTSTHTSSFKVPSMTGTKPRKICLQRPKKSRSIEPCVHEREPITTKLNITPFQIDGAKNLLRIIPTVDSRNTHRSRTRFCSHAIMITNRTRHIKIMQTRQGHGGVKTRTINTSRNISKRSKDFVIHRRHNSRRPTQNDIRRERDNVT
jgi:hypothetical protein